MDIISKIISVLGYPAVIGLAYSAYTTGSLPTALASLMLLVMVALYNRAAYMLGSLTKAMFILTMIKTGSEEEIDGDGISTTTININDKRSIRILFNKQTREVTLQCGERHEK